MTEHVLVWHPKVSGEAPAAAVGDDQLRLIGMPTGLVRPARQALAADQLTPEAREIMDAVVEDLRRRIETPDAPPMRFRLNGLDEAGKAAMQPFSGDLFKGMLAFFLLDMGLMAARNLGELRGKPPALLAYAVLGPITHASLALALAMLVGLSPGDGALLMVLAASASYIAVPAVLRYAVPEANPSLYFGMSLGVTFPLNILLGIPVYSGVASLMLG